MNPHRPQATARFMLVSFFSFFAFCLAAAPPAGAQQQGSPTRVRDLRGAERDILARENEAKRKSEPARDPSAVMAEVNEDFARLRELTDELKKAAPAEGSPDYGAVALAAADVRKRAARLDANLSGLPKGEKKPKYNAPGDDAQARESLKALGELLTSFLSNPVFSDVGTPDPQLVVKARRDLDGLLVLSEAVRKGSEKLAKR